MNQLLNQQMIYDLLLMTLTPCLIQAPFEGSRKTSWSAMLTEIVATNKSLKDEDETVKDWTLDSSMISGSVLQVDLFFHKRLQLNFGNEHLNGGFKALSM